MDLIQFGFNHFDDAADAQHGLLVGGDDHFAPLDAPVDDGASSSGSIGSSSRCASPTAFDSLPRFDFGLDESKYAGDLNGKLSAGPAPASVSRYGLSIMLPSSEETFAVPLPAALPSAAAGPPLARPAVRRVAKVQPGVAVHRAAVAAPAGVVAAQVVSGRVVAAAVMDDTFSGPALPAHVRSSEPAESVSSDDTGFFGGRPRLASISTASTPGSPVCAASVVDGRAASFFGGSRPASPVSSVLGKRKATVASAVPAKRARASYANASAAVSLPKERMVLVYRGLEHGVAPAAPRTFVVTDESARIFTATVGVEPSCTCREFEAGSLCEHLVFVFGRVLKVPLTSPLVTQTRLTVAQLAQIYGAAPEAERPPQAQGGAGRRRRSLVVRQGTDGRECSLCCEPFSADNLSYCMSGCGTNFHQGCLQRWHAYTARTTTVVAAKVVSSAVEPPHPHAAAGGDKAGAMMASAAEAPRPAEPLGAEPACCPVCRCHWKEEDDHLDVKSPSGSSADMDSLGYASPLGGAETFFDSFDFGGDILVV